MGNLIKYRRVSKDQSRVSKDSTRHDSVESDAISTNRMKKNLLLSVLLVSGIVFAGAGCSMSSQTSVNVPVPKINELEKTMIVNDSVGDITVDTSVTSKSTGTYEVYESSKLALAAQGPVVLFFHAPWCPTCKAADTDINANLAAIPAGTTILKVDYDSNSELKKKYGVTYQHTFVQVNADGSMIKKWSGGNTLSSITAQIK